MKPEHNTQIIGGEYSAAYSTGRELACKILYGRAKQKRRAKAGDGAKDS